MNLDRNHIMIAVGIVLLLCLFYSKKETFYGIQNPRDSTTLPRVGTLSRIIRDQSCDPDEPPQFGLLPVC